MPTTALDVMTSPAIVVSPSTTLGAIATLLVDRCISAVPVCKADGTLVGLVSEGDILRPIRESTRSKREWWLGLLSDGEGLSQDFLDYLRHDTQTAESVMARDVVTADANATVPELAELMTGHGIKRVPILRDGRVIGIVSRADLLAEIARAPALLV